MAEFRFKTSSKRTFKVDGAGEFSETYEYDAGNASQLKAWLSKIKELEQMLEAIDKDKDNVIDDVVALEKEIVIMVLGEWDPLWAAAGENIFAMLELVNALGAELVQALEEQYKEHGLK